MTIKCDPLGKKVYRMDTEHAHMLYLGNKNFSLYIYIYILQNKEKNIQIIKGENGLNEYLSYFEQINQIYIHKSIEICN